MRKKRHQTLVSRASVSPTRRFAIDRSIDVDGDGDTADARARRGVVRSPRARATTKDERDARRTEEEDIVISSGDDDDVAIRVRDGTGVLLNFSNKQTPRV